MNKKYLRPVFSILISVCFLLPLLSNRALSQTETPTGSLEPGSVIVLPGDIKLQMLSQGFMRLIVPPTAVFDPKTNSYILLPDPSIIKAFSQSKTGVSSAANSTEKSAVSSGTLPPPPPGTKLESLSDGSIKMTLPPGVSSLPKESLPPGAVFDDKSKAVIFPPGSVGVPSLVGAAPSTPPAPAASGIDMSTKGSDTLPPPIPVQPGFGPLPPTPIEQPQPQQP